MKIFDYYFKMTVLELIILKNVNIQAPDNTYRCEYLHGYFLQDTIYTKMSFDICVQFFFHSPLKILIGSVTGIVNNFQKTATKELGK